MGMHFLTGSAVITIIGSNFAAPLSVFVGTQPCTVLSLMSLSVLTCRLAADTGRHVYFYFTFMYMLLIICSLYRECRGPSINFICLTNLLFFVNVLQVFIFQCPYGVVLLLPRLI